MSALTLRATVTNWMAGLLATFFRHRPGRFARITLDALLVVGVLWAVQKAVFPSADFIVSRRTATVVNHVMRDEAGGVPHILQDFFCHSMVMPEPVTADIHMRKPYYLGWRRMSVQMSAAGSASPLGPVAVALWLALLPLGLWSFLLDREGTWRRFRLAFGLLLLGQIALHLLFGYETFHFSLHYRRFSWCLPLGRHGGACGPLGGSWPARAAAASDTVPLHEVAQHIAPAEGECGPVVVTETPDYRARWTAAGPGRFRLDLGWPGRARERAALMIRSVGPAGGDVRSLDWDGKRLLVDERRRVTPVPAPEDVILGEEDAGGWRWREGGATRLESDTGWGCARLEPASNETRIEILDEKANAGEQDDSAAGGPQHPFAASSGLQLDLPDPVFIDSLDAQPIGETKALFGQRATRFPSPWFIPVTSRRPTWRPTSTW